MAGGGQPTCPSGELQAGGRACGCRGEREPGRAGAEPLAYRASWGSGGARAGGSASRTIAPRGRLTTAEADRSAMQMALVRKSTREDSGSGGTADGTPRMKPINARSGRSPFRRPTAPPARATRSPRRSRSSSSASATRAGPHARRLPDANHTRTARPPSRSAAQAVPPPREFRTTPDAYRARTTLEASAHRQEAAAQAVHPPSELRPTPGACRTRVPLEPNVHREGARPNQCLRQAS